MGRVSLQTRRALLQSLIPQYREASSVKRKSKLLDAFTATTGYNRKYAIWLLNHAKEGQPLPQHPRPRRYGPDVQHALFLVWHAANRICAKRLIPFLPTLIEALERHEHLHLTEECRSQLLSMSAATADRLLHSQRKRGQRGLSTTRAGTLLKQQIPIRTFEAWNETRPGFLEADLVAHCGEDREPQPRDVPGPTGCVRRRRPASSVRFALECADVACPRATPVCPSGSHAPASSATDRSG